MNHESENTTEPEISTRDVLNFMKQSRLELVDRAVLLWDTKDLTQKEHKSLRVNIDFDHPTYVKWSPDCKAFIISKFHGNAVEVYKIEKKKDGWLGSATKALTFPKVVTESVRGDLWYPVFKAPVHPDTFNGVAEEYYWPKMKSDLSRYIKRCAICLATKSSPLSHSGLMRKETEVHDEDIIGLGIACNGKFIMTCSNKTDLIIWDLRGQELSKIDTYLMNTSSAKISPCGRFIVASGFAPDVKVWEVVFSKSGEFQEVKRVFELSGHTSGVYDVAFDVDASHIATVSKDGTWKLFDTKVDYKRGEDPHLKITSKYETAGSSAHIALSPNAEVVVIGTYNRLSFYSTLTGQLDTVIENIFNGSVTSLLFDSTGKYVLASGDKYIRVFHNVTGYRCDISTAKDKLKSNQTSATKERLEKVILENEAFLKSIGVSEQ